jgi:hypothetical protein
MCNGLNVASLARTKPNNANALNKIGRAYSNEELFYHAMQKHRQAKVLVGAVEFHIGHYINSLYLLEGALAVFKKEFGPEHEIDADTLHATLAPIAFFS